MRNKKLVLQCGLFFEWRISSKDFKKLINTFGELKKKELTLLLKCFSTVINSNRPMFETPHTLLQLSKCCLDEALDLLKDQKA